MTALAILGSAISTSLMSRGRSITTDFPTPSGMKRAFRSLPTTSIPGAAAAAPTGRWSLAEVGPIATIPSAVIDVASAAVRVSIVVAMVRSLVGAFGLDADILVLRNANRDAETG